MAKAVSAIRAADVADACKIILPFADTQREYDIGQSPEKLDERRKLTSSDIFEQINRIEDKLPKRDQTQLELLRKWLLVVRDSDAVPILKTLIKAYPDNALFRELLQKVELIFPEFFWMHNFLSSSNYHY